MKIIQSKRSPWVAIAIAFLAVTFSSGSVNAGLPKEVLKDKYMMGLSKSLKEKDYDKAFAMFVKLDKLKVKLPPSTLYFRGETYYKLKRFKEANKVLSDYLGKAGKKGKYYKEALTLLLELEEAPKKERIVFVKGGCFAMGGRNNKYLDPWPEHKVCVDDFYIGKYEVTQKEWESVMGRHKVEHAELLGYEECDNCPVGDVTWMDVQKYIKRLNSKTGKTYRLPTEAEWEYAARSGGKKEKYAGFSDEALMYQYANFCDSNCQDLAKDRTNDQDDGYKNAAPVGSFKPNGLGLYDMTGNVDEWVNDRYDENYYQNSPKDNPRGPSQGKVRVYRGGNYDLHGRLGSFSGDLETFARNKTEGSFKYWSHGFRLAMSPQ